MDLVQLLVVIVVFACVVWGLSSACSRFAMPPPVLWVVGAVVIIILLLFLLKVTGLYAPADLHRPLFR